MSSIMEAVNVNNHMGSSKSSYHSQDSEDSGSQQNASPTEEQIDSVWGEVDRSGYPEDSDKSKPWKETGEYVESDSPSSWNLPGRVWARVIVFVDGIRDLGTNRT
jgi:hypothetical protein